jgi:hypothetical protein
MIVNVSMNVDGVKTAWTADSGLAAAAGAPYPRRIRDREQLWNGNTETLSSAVWGRESLFAWALRSHFRRRREWPRALASRRVIRLTTPAGVERFLTQAERLDDLNSDREMSW